MARSAKRLGQKYVDETFGADGKERMLKMVDALEMSLDQDIEDLPWMTRRHQEAGQGEAAGDPQQDRLSGHVARLQFGWRSSPTTCSAMCMRANEFESKRQIAKIGKPLDRKEWGMTPPTVNAYYSAVEQRDRVSRRHSAAAVLRQEYGRRGEFRRHRRGDRARADARLRRPGPQVRSAGESAGLVDGDRTARNSRSARAAWPTSIRNFVAVDDLKLNGQLTLGENTADNGGARIALAALEHMIAEDKTGKAGQKIDGYTPEQRFFLGFGRVWCEKQRPEFSRLQVTIDRTRRGSTA